MSNIEILKELRYALVISFISTFLICTIIGTFAPFVPYMGFGVIGVAIAKVYIWKKEASGE